MPFHFDPPLLPVQAAAIVFLAIAASVGLSLLVAHPPRSFPHVLLAAIRTLMVAFLGILFLNPVLPGASERTRHKAPFAILIDTSRSMQTRDTPSISGWSHPSSRWASVKHFVIENSALLDGLSQRYELRFFRFEDHLLASSRKELSALSLPQGDHTRIGEALQQAVGAPGLLSNSIPLGGIMLVSDGRDNGAIDAVDAARGASASVYTLCIGREKVGTRFQLTAQSPRLIASPGQTVEIAGALRTTNGAPARVTIDLIREGRKIRSKSLRLTASTTEFDFTVVERGAGSVRYSLSCVSSGLLKDLENAHADVSLTVTRARMRVLLLEGYPSWDSKFLAQTLREDPAIALDSIFQLTDTHRFALSSGTDTPILHVPQTLEGFGHYDAILLGQGMESFFSASTAGILRRWVSDRGGNLVFLRGQTGERMPAFRDLDPFLYGDRELAATGARLTDAGRSFPGFHMGNGDADAALRALPALSSVNQVEKEKALAVVLARIPSSAGREGSDMPILAYQRYGQGAVVAVTGEGLWQWAFPSPDIEKYGRVYHNFWTQTVRWLVSGSDFLPGQNVALRADRSAYTVGETATLRGFLREEATGTLPRIRIEGPDGTSATLTPKKEDGSTADFLSTYRVAIPGAYKATALPSAGVSQDLPATADFSVHSGLDEDSDRTADTALMGRIAAASGGKAITAAEIGKLPERLRIAENASSKNRGSQTIWDRSGIFVLLLGLLTCDWALRRR